MPESENYRYSTVYGILVYFIVYTVYCSNKARRQRKVQAEIRAGRQSARQRYLHAGWQVESGRHEQKRADRLAGRETFRK